MRGAFFAWACAALTLGCDQVSGIDDYTIEDERPVPYLDGADCRACLDAKCAAAQSACEADDLCRDTLACRRKSTDPEEHFDCAYPEDHERAWQELAFPQPADDTLARCAMTSCRAACSVGRSWQCVGGYDWPLPPNGELIVRHRAFRAGDFATPIPLAMVRVCSRTDVDCSGPLAQDTTRDDGSVDLSIQNVTNFDVYLSVDATPDYEPHLLFGPLRPRFTKEYSGNGMPRNADLHTTLESVGAAFDPTRAYVFAQFFDCGGLWSHDLVAELSTFDGTKLEPIYAENLLPSLTAEHTTAAPGTQAFFIGVDPVPVVLVARDRSSGKRVARAELMLRPGRIHMLGLQALTTALAGAE